MNLAKKRLNPFFAQISDFELRMAEPFANERKNVGFESGQRMIFKVLLFHWQMAQPFAVKNLNLEQKGVHPFCLPDSLKSFPLVFVDFQLPEPLHWRYIANMYG